MTDISDLREGDEIEMVIKAKIVGDGTWMTTSGRHPRWFGEELFPEIAERITVILPEIIPGKYYTDAEGEFYYGYQTPAGVGVSDIHGNLFGIATPLPAGLRPAKVVPE